MGTVPIRYISLASWFIVPCNGPKIFWPAKADVAMPLKRDGNLIPGTTYMEGRTNIKFMLSISWRFITIIALFLKSHHTHLFIIIIIADYNKTFKSIIDCKMDWLFDYWMVRINKQSASQRGQTRGFRRIRLFLFSYKIIKFDKQILHLVRQFNSSRLQQFATLYSL